MILDKLTLPLTFAASLVVGAVTASFAVGTRVASVESAQARTTEDVERLKREHEHGTVAQARLEEKVEAVKETVDRIARKLEAR